MSTENSELIVNSRVKELSSRKDNTDDEIDEEEVKSEFSDESVDDIEIESYHTLPFKYTFLNRITQKQILIEANALDIIKSIQIWTKQRILEERHINDIVEYQSRYYKAKKTFNFIGLFYICGVKNRDYRIIDGQHRLSAINYLAKMYPEYTFNVIVWVIDVNTEEDRIECFQNINLARSISFTDFLLDDESQIINKTAEHFYNKYRNFFSDTQLLHPKRPNMKLDTFKNELLHEEVVDKLHIGKAEELIGYIEKYNLFLGSQSPDNFPKKNKSNNDKLFALATKKGKLYLGMYPNFEWIEKMVESVLYNKNVTSKIEIKEPEPKPDEIFNKKSVINVLNEPVPSKNLKSSKNEVSDKHKINDTHELDYQKIQKLTKSDKSGGDELKQIENNMRRLLQENKTKPVKAHTPESDDEKDKEQEQEKPENKRRFVLKKE